MLYEGTQKYMKTRFLSGFLAVVGGGAAIVGCFEPTKKVSADTPRVVTSPAPTPSPLPQQSVALPEAPAVAAVPTTLSPGVSEVAKLYQSNVSEDVLLAYIKNYSQPFYASADEILYLNDLGVSDNVITAVLQHKSDTTTPANVAAAEPVQQAQAAPPAPAPQPAATAPLVPQENAPVTTVAAPATQVTVTHFYDTLSPYGTWVETEYGRSWRPAVVVSNPGWRPYCDRGHWIYTDCGWYWVSDYSWGWATFHYGRWCSDLRYGWVWVPDTVWGPSWVSWRYTSDHCGWAPLPPLARFNVGVGFTFRSANVGVSFDFGLSDSCYTFVPVNRFCDPHPYRYCAPRDSVKVIYNRSTVINNYVVNNNTTIINEGVGRHRIETATKQPIQKVAIHEMPKSSGAAPDRIHRVGNDLVVYKPQAPEAVKPKFGSSNPDRNAWGGKSTTPTSAWGKNPQGNGNNVAAQPGKPFGSANGRNDASAQKPAPGVNTSKPENPGRGSNSPRVVTQPKRDEAPASSSLGSPKAAQPQAPVVSNNPGRGNRHNEEKPKQVSSAPAEVKPVTPAAPQNTWRPQGVAQPQLPGSRPAQPQARPTTPAAPQQAYQAPLVPQTPAPSSNPFRGNGNGREIGGSGNSSRFESPRLSSPAAPATPATPSYSAPSAPRSVVTAPSVPQSSYRPQPMTPSVPRSAPQQAVAPRSHGNGGGNASHASPGQQRSEGSGKLAERESGRGRY